MQRTELRILVAAMLLLAGTVSAQAQKEFQMPRTEDGWADLPKRDRKFDSCHRNQG